jgi:hypothetical protein
MSLRQTLRGSAIAWGFAPLPLMDDDDDDDKPV